MKRKGKKKSNISISRTTLNTQKIKFCMQIFFFKKCSFEYENQFAVKKKHKKFLGPISKILWKNFCRRHQKNASHTISIYGNCMTSVFFQRTKIKKSQSCQRGTKFKNSSLSLCITNFLQRHKNPILTDRQFTITSPRRKFRCQLILILKW